MDWFKFGKGVCQGCILSPCFLNLYVECTMRNAGLDESPARIKKKITACLTWYFELKAKWKITTIFMINGAIG